MNNAIGRDIDGVLSAKQVGFVSVVYVYAKRGAMKANVAGVDHGALPGWKGSP